MFRKTPPRNDRAPQPASPEVHDLGQMAVDALAGSLRAMAEFALDQEHVDAVTFRQLAEAWAQHLIVAAPAPGAPAPAEEPGQPTGRRDWQGLRQFVRDYCRSSAKHAASVTSDLRDVIWVFIRNFSQTLASSEESDERVRQQVARLERLVQASAASELKREALEIVGGLTQTFEDRRQRQRAQMTALGETVRALGDELESARREGEMDPLTRIANRKAFDAYLQRSVEMFGAFRQPMCLLLVDVDEFKGVNDTCGHLVGDKVLSEVADALVRVFLRKSDFVARFGGDEFAVVLRDTAPKDAVPLAERALSRIRGVTVAAADRDVAVSVSIGAAAIEPGDDASAWFQRADRGLYAAKAAGRSRVAVGEPGPAAAAPAESAAR